MNTGSSHPAVGPGETRRESMSWGAFADVVEWMLPRWTDMTRWAPEETRALYDDVRWYDPADVRRAVERLWNEGREKPPRGGTIRGVLDGMGIRPPTKEEICEHRWSHEGPSRATGNVRVGAGERMCVRCHVFEQCDCGDCRADPAWREEETE